MSRERLYYIPVLAGIAAALAVPVTAAADSGFVAPLDEVPLTNPIVAGARAAGMGFVSIAVADDASAITTNPAALARLNRAELSGGFRRSSFGIDGEMAGSAFETDLSGTGFASFRFAYPFPTFRGSLVFGLSNERVYDLDVDRLAEYEGWAAWDEHPNDGVDLQDSVGVWYQREDYLSDGGISAFSAACAVDVSPAISLGVTLSYLHGDYSSKFAWDLDDLYDESDRYTDVHIAEQYDSDVSGFRATVGSLFYVSDKLSAGVAIDTPTTLTFDGTEYGYARKIAAVPESTTVDEWAVLFSDEITVPFAFRGGLAFVPADFLVLGFDLTYSDWSEMDYAGRITDTETGSDGSSRRSFYDETLGYGIGAEFTVPSWPLRLRGGYSSRPVAYNGLEVVTDRSYFTLGAGFLIDTVLAIDVAWVKGAYERSASYEIAEGLVDDYDESVDDSALVIEAAYRF